MIDSAVPMILMAFGMSLHGTKPLQQKGDRPAIFTVAVLKNIIMPIIAFLLAYFVMASAAPSCTPAWYSPLCPPARTYTTTRPATTWVSPSRATAF